MAENISIEIQLKTAGLTSIKQLEAEIRKVRDSFKTAELGTKEYEAAAKRLPELLDLKSKAMERVASSNARMMKSYFQTGQQIRVNALPALQEFSRVVQDAPFGIQGVANNITQLVSTFGTLSRQTGSATSALRAMIGSLAGPAGILLAVSAVTSLAVAFGDKLFPKVEKVKEKIDGLVESLRKIGEISAEEALGHLVKRMNEMNQEFDRTAEKFATGQAIAAVSGPLGTFFAGLFGATVGDFVDANKARADSILKVRDATKELNKEIEQSGRLAAAQRGPLGMLVLPGVGGMIPGTGKPSPHTVPTWMMKKEPPIGGQKDISRAEQNYINMFSRVSDVFANNMMQAWEKIFGEANSLFEQLLASMAAALADMYAKYALGSFLSFLGLPGIGGALIGASGIISNYSGGTISEPVLGVGASGRMYSFAERGPEYVVPSHELAYRSGGGGGTMQPLVKVVPITDNRGLAVRVEVGDRQRAGSRY